MLFSGQVGQTKGQTASTQYQAVTANASANTKGSYSQITASCPYTLGLIVMLAAVSTDDLLIDIAVGAAASESIVVPDILFCNLHGLEGYELWLPALEIPAGSRVSARCQATTGGVACNVGCKFFTPDMVLPGTYKVQKVINYGSNSVDSGGTGIDPGGSVNTKGAYSQIVASTTALHRCLAFCFGAQLNTAPQAARGYVDVAIGAGGSETIIDQDISIRSGTSTVQGNWKPGYVTHACHVPTGTRLSARAQANITDATDRLMDMVILGM